MALKLGIDQAKELRQKLTKGDTIKFVCADNSDLIVIHIELDMEYFWLYLNGRIEYFSRRFDSFLNKLNEFIINHNLKQK